MLSDVGTVYASKSECGAMGLAKSEGKDISVSSCLGRICFRKCNHTIPNVCADTVEYIF